MGAIGHNAVQEGYIGPETTWANEMNLGMNHGSGVGTIARPGDLLAGHNSTFQGYIEPGATWVIIR